jgi:predicted phage tail component-like protein
MIEVTVNGVTFSSLGLGVKRHDIPVLPPTKDYSVEIAGMDGEIDFGSTYGPRLINIECILMADNPTIDYQAKVAAIAAFFNAKKGDMKFTFSDIVGKWYMARYCGSMAIEKIIFDGNITIPLKMHDPYAYASIDGLDGEYFYDTGLEYDSGLIYPNARVVQDWAFLGSAMIVPVGVPRVWAGFMWSYPTHFSSQHNYGVETPLIIEIVGNVVNPTITNNSTGHSITITTSLINQTLLIDGKKGIVTINGVNAAGQMIGDFLELAEGENKFTFTGITPNASVTYKWINKIL